MNEAKLLMVRATIKRAMALELNQIAPTKSLNADQQCLRERAQTMLKEAIELEAEVPGEQSLDVRQQVAADICALMLLKGQVFGRFAITVDELSKVTHLPTAELKAVIAWAVENDWLGLGATHLELKAAGIYIAKEILDLPR